MYCQKWNISFVFGAVRKRQHSCGFKCLRRGGGGADILPQQRLILQDGLHFQNEQLISFFASKSFDCDYSTAKPLPLGYTERKGFGVASGGRKECRLWGARSGLVAGRPWRYWCPNSIHLPSLNIRYCPHPPTNMDRMPFGNPLLISFWEWKGGTGYFAFSGEDFMMRHFFIRLWWCAQSTHLQYTQSDSDTQAVYLHTPSHNLFSLMGKTAQTDG